jgi:hypothetical protein
VWERTANMTTLGHNFPVVIALEEIISASRDIQSALPLGEGFRFERRYLPISVWLCGAVLVMNVSLVAVSLMA